VFVALLKFKMLIIIAHPELLMVVHYNY